MVSIVILCLILDLLSAINLMVSPTHVSAGVGVAVTLECLAIGNLIQSISWNRDFESLQNGKVLTVV